MKQTSNKHQYDLDVFSSYLGDVRIGTGVAMLAVTFIAFSLQLTNNIYTAIWALAVLIINLINLMSFKFFKSTFDEKQLSRFKKWHYFLHGLSGASWGLVCVVLHFSNFLVLQESLVLCVLSVIVAYAASVMSASLRGMLAYTIPILVCVLIYFAVNFVQYQWWFVGALFLGVATLLFGNQNRKHVNAKIENQLLNKKYIDELSTFKDNVEEANMHLVMKNEALIAAQKRLETMATHDELTEVYNRRYAMEYINKTLAELQRHYDDFVVVLADIDHFKKINDQFGHPAGDAVLKGFTRLLKLELREMDTVARYGGEEFLILLPKTNAAEAKKIVQRLCDLVADKPYIFERKKVNVTCSFGLSHYQKNDTVEKLIERADQALYNAKSSGRNTVKIYDEVDITF